MLNWITHPLVLLAWALFVFAWMVTHPQPWWQEYPLTTPALFFALGWGAGMFFAAWLRRAGEGVPRGG